jgi:DHA2 family multidrug resistance protein-like MFS transporter
LVTGTLFARRQASLADPLIDLRLFRIPTFSLSLGMNMLAVFVSFGYFLFIAQYLQLVLGLSPFDAGLWTLPWTAAFIIGSTVTPPLARRLAPAYLMGAGLALSGVGYWMVTGFDTSTRFMEFALATFVFSLGAAPVFTLTTDLIIGSAPSERAGAASAVSETSAEFGGALGIAIFGSIGVAVYRALMPDALPLDLSADAGAAAVGTLGGAVEVAGSLSTEAGQALLATARSAFVRGMRLCAWISAAGSLALSIFALATLRRVRGGPSAEAPPAPVAAPADQALAV